jgi:NADH-quinone oxidoreductase subunit N
LSLWLSLATGIPDREDSADYATLLVGGTLGMMLMASADHLLTAFVAIEMASVPSYTLAGFLKGRRQGSEAALKYVVYGASAAGVMLYGISLITGAYGTGSFPAVSRAIADAQGALPLPVWIGVACVLVGLGFKLAAVPFHFWCPDVFEGAAAEVGAFLSVASKAAALALTARFLFAFGAPTGDGQGDPSGSALSLVWGVFAAVTATFGNLAALAQTNLKRLLAYSSIGHVGYMLAGLAAGTAFGLSSVIFYLLVYTFTNVGAFAVLIVMSRYVEDENITSYSGLARRAPWLSAAMAFCLLSLAGLPPLAGFFGKLYIFWAVAEHGMYWLVLAGVINSAISLYYYARVIRQMYLVEAPSAKLAEPLEEPRVGVGFAPALSLAAAVIGIFVIGPFSGPFIQAAVGAAQGIVP